MVYLLPFLSYICSWPRKRFRQPAHPPETANEVIRIRLSFAHTIPTNAQVKCRCDSSSLAIYTTLAYLTTYSSCTVCSERTTEQTVDESPSPWTLTTALCETLTLAFRTQKNIMDIDERQTTDRQNSAVVTTRDDREIDFDWRNSIAYIFIHSRLCRQSVNRKNS